VPVTSWVPGAAGSGFAHDHLPYGVFSAGSGTPRIGVRVGAAVLDLTTVARLENAGWASVVDADALNPLMAAGPARWDQVRAFVTAAVTDPARRPVVEPRLYPLAEVTLHRPFQVADYVDFYSSEHHAGAVGRMFRPGSDPLPVQWRHLPIGYHGRAGTVVASGTPIVRPCGQRRPVGQSVPTFGPSRRLDIEAELGFVVGVGSELSYPVAAGAFAEHVFGVCLVNDWSARDIQAWETVPLGPFQGKSFATSISHWITPLAALQAARISPPPRTDTLLDYLADDPAQPWALDIDLAVTWNHTLVSGPSYSWMYWTGPQLLAQLTANGASVRAGDLFASGTISGPDLHAAGSILELSMNGQREIQLDDGSLRTFLLDGDTVTITGTTRSTSGGRLRLGPVIGTIAPART